MQQKARDRADRRADHGEQHDRREPQPLRDRLAQRHHDQQRGEYGQDEDDVEHVYSVCASSCAPRTGALPRHCQV